MLNVDNLSKTFQSGDTEVKAVNGISFTVPDGQFAAIVGRSGSGKSTLLSLLGGLDKPTGGSIQVDDRVLTKSSDRDLIQYRRKAVGFVFQGYNLIPNLDAIENVMLPMEFAGVSKNARRERAESLLTQVGLTGNKQHRRPTRLSGGEQQRVKTGKAIFSLLHGLARSENTTIIVVTHDTSIAGRTDVKFELEDGQLISTASTRPEATTVTSS